MKTFAEFLEEKYGDSIDEMTRPGPNRPRPIKQIVMNNVIPPARIAGYAAKGVADLASRGVAAGVTSVGKGIIKAGEKAQAGIDKIPGIDTIAQGFTDAAMPKAPPASKRKPPKSVSTLKINNPEEKEKEETLMDRIIQMNKGGSLFDVHNQ